MTASIYILGAYELRSGKPRPVIECDDAGCVWIRHGADTVALKLTDAQFADLVEAIATARDTCDLPVEERA